MDWEIDDEEGRVEWGVMEVSLEGVEVWKGNWVIIKSSEKDWPEVEFCMEG